MGGSAGKPTRPGATDAIIILVDNRGLGPVRYRGHFPPPSAEKRMKHTFRIFTKVAGTWSAFLAVVATAGITNISAARADATDAKNLLKAMSDYLAAQKAYRSIMM